MKRGGELRWWYDILDDALENRDGVVDFARYRRRFSTTPEELLPQAESVWAERLPALAEVPSGVPEIAEWIASHHLDDSLRESLGELKPEWRYLGEKRRLQLPLIRDVVFEPQLRRRYLPEKDYEALLVAWVRRRLRPAALMVGLRRYFDDLADEALPDDAVGQLVSALGEAARRSLPSAPRRLASEAVWAGGVESGEEVYCFGTLDSVRAYRMEPVVARLGLWADQVEEMYIACGCGGTVTRPCSHLAMAFYHCVDALRRPAHPGHDVLLARAASPARRSSLEVLSQSALLASEAAPATSEADERVVWRLYSYGATWHLEPAIQVRSKRGGWTKGRKVSSGAWDLEHSEGLTEGDRSLLDAYCGPDLSWMRDLAGHPLVYMRDAPSQPVIVTETPISLAVTEEDEVLRLGFRFGGRRLSVQEMNGCLDPPNGLAARYDAGAGRFFFAPVTDSLRDLIRTLRSVPSRVPKERLPELTELLARRPGTLPVHVGKSLRRDNAAPNLTPVLRMTPEGEASLSVSVGFHLFGDELWTDPGEGAAYLLRGVKGEPVGMHRNFHEERRIAQEVLIRLDTTELTPVGPWSFLATDIDAVVSLLAAVRELELPHAVEWPAGKRPWRVSDIGAGDARIQISKKKGHLFEFGLDIPLDDGEITLAQLLEALRSGSRYVRLGSGQFARIEESLKAIAELVTSVDSGGTKSAVSLAPAAVVPVSESLAGTDAVVNADKAWRALVANMDRVKALRPRVSKLFNGTLRAYQREGYYWLARLKELGLGGCLADDMGLGKTVQALALLQRKPGTRPSLVVAPTSVISNWQREAERFAPNLIPVLHHGPDRREDFAGLGGRHLVITTYDVLARDSELFERHPFDTAVIDEAQFIKNSATQRARAVFALEAETKVALTGTPIENQLGELWSIFNAVAPGLLGTQRRFHQRFTLPIQKHGDTAAMAQLAAIIRPFVLRRTKKVVAPELPPRTETVRPVELYPEERTQYEARRRAVLDYLSKSSAEKAEEKMRFDILAQITKLRRSVCHPRLVDSGSLLPSAKLDSAFELITDLLGQDNRMLVFSQFTGHLALLRERLDANGFTYFYLDGATPAIERGRLMSAWLEGGGALFLISLKAGGTGLNLTGADYVIHLDPWWNPAVEDQATDRTHRIGQTKPVTVIRMIATDTIEEAVIALHEKKRDLAEGILRGTGAAGALSTEELIDLIRQGG